jgi:hypothetical protein
LKRLKKKKSQKQSQPVPKVAPAKFDDLAVTGPTNFVVTERFAAPSQNNNNLYTPSAGKDLLPRQTPAMVATMFGQNPEGDPRWTDTFTMLPTTVIRSHTIFQLGMTSGGSAYTFHSAFIATGSGAYTMVKDVGFSTYAPSWTSSGTQVDCGLNNSNFQARPIAVVVKCIYTATGIEHPITFSALPTEPLCLPVASAPTSWCTDYRVPLTTAQAYNGGRYWNLVSGDSVTLCSVPVDPDSVNFTPSDVKRTAADAWTGWSVWINGLDTADKLMVHVTVVEEAFAMTAAAASYPHTTRPPDTQKLDKSISLAERLLSWGWQAFKTSAAFVGKTLLSAAISNALLMKDLGMWNAKAMETLGITAGCNPLSYIQEAAIARLLARQNQVQFPRKRSPPPPPPLPLPPQEEKEDDLPFRDSPVNTPSGLRVDQNRGGRTVAPTQRAVASGDRSGN